MLCCHIQIARSIFLSASVRPDGSQCSCHNMCCDPEYGSVWDKLSTRHDTRFSCFSADRFTCPHSMCTSSRSQASRWTQSWVRIVYIRWHYPLLLSLREFDVKGTEYFLISFNCRCASASHSSLLASNNLLNGSGHLYSSVRDSGRFHRDCCYFEANLPSIQASFATRYSYRPYRYVA